MESASSALVEIGKRFTGRWIAYCTFKLGAQVDGVPGASVTPLIKKSQSPGGVCEAMCIDWIRRKKTEAPDAVRKDSFSSTKHSPQTSAGQMKGGQKTHMERMERKILGHGDTLGYAQIQGIYAETTQQNLNASDVQKKQALLAELARRKQKFRGLQVRVVGEGQRVWIKPGRTGSALFRTIITACEEERKNEEILKLDKISPCYKISFYQGWKPSHTVALQITHEPATNVTDETDETEDALSVTMGQTGSSIYRIHFLDQSLGEFQFLAAAVGSQFDNFCDDMWVLNRLMYKHAGESEWNYWQAFQYYWV